MHRQWLTRGRWRNSPRRCAVRGPARREPPPAWIPNWRTASGADPRGPLPSPSGGGESAQDRYQLVAKLRSASRPPLNRTRSHAVPLPRLPVQIDPLRPATRPWLPNGAEATTNCHHLVDPNIHGFYLLSRQWPVPVLSTRVARVHEHRLGQRCELVEKLVSEKGAVVSRVVV